MCVYYGRNKRKTEKSVKTIIRNTRARDERVGTDDGGGKCVVVVVIGATFKVKRARGTRRSTRAGSVVVVPRNIIIIIIRTQALTGEEFGSFSDRPAAVILRATSRKGKYKRKKREPERTGLSPTESLLVHRDRRAHKTINAADTLYGRRSNRNRVIINNITSRRDKLKKKKKSRALRVGKPENGGKVARRLRLPRVPAER